MTRRGGPGLDQTPEANTDIAAGAAARAGWAEVLCSGFCMRLSGNADLY